MGPIWIQEGVRFRPKFDRDRSRKEQQEAGIEIIFGKGEAARVAGCLSSNKLGPCVQGLQLPNGGIHGKRGCKVRQHGECYRCGGKIDY